jgi:hypothetical protein
LKSGRIEVATFAFQTAISSSRTFGLPYRRNAGLAMTARDA